MAVTKKTCGNKVMEEHIKQMCEDSFAESRERAKRQLKELKEEMVGKLTTTEAAKKQRLDKLSETLSQLVNEEKQNARRAGNVNTGDHPGGKNGHLGTQTGNDPVGETGQQSWEQVSGAAATFIFNALTGTNPHPQLYQ